MVRRPMKILILGQQDQYRKVKTQKEKKKKREGAFKKKVVAATGGPPLPPIAAAAARATFPSSTRHNLGNNNNAIKPAKYVFVFDYDHTLTNSYGIGTHSMGRSYNGNGLFTKYGEPSEGLYNSSDMTRGTYNKLLEQLSYFKKNGVLMFVNSRGIQSQLLQRLRDDNLLQYFGISDEEGADETIPSEFNAKGNIDKGVYGANTDKDIASRKYTKEVNAEKWGHLKVKVIKNILEKLKEKKMIDADTEVHFFDDEPGNVEKFNIYGKLPVTEYSTVGHDIGNRDGAGKPSITEKLKPPLVIPSYYH